MDRLIKRFNAEADEDLMLCLDQGIAYQRNMARGRISYNGAYFEHYKSYAGSQIEIALNEGRVGLLKRHAPPGAKVLDYGIGSGSFLNAARCAGFSAYGFDINPNAVEWLQERGWFSEDARSFANISAWDSIEHIEQPEVLLKRVQQDALLVAAVPLMEDLSLIRKSKHYKPGEHLYYFTEEGFVDWMGLYGFRLLERSDHEVRAGRESIGAFAFRRDLPGYHEHVQAYKEIHSTKHYGDSATELYLPLVTSIVKALAPKSILDYGCGRSDLSSHFWLDGERQIVKYDPAIPRFSNPPEGEFDLVLACDVLEHIPMASVDRVLQEIWDRSHLAFFTISTRLAKARLPDGRNAHVTILKREEWVRWIKERFSDAVEFTPSNEHEVLVLAGPAAKTIKRRIR